MNVRDDVRNYETWISTDVYFGSRLAQRCQCTWTAWTRERSSRSADAISKAINQDRARRPLPELLPMPVYIGVDLGSTAWARHPSTERTNCTGAISCSHLLAARPDDKRGYRIGGKAVNKSPRPPPTLPLSSRTPRGIDLVRSTRFFSDRDRVN